MPGASDREDVRLQEAGKEAHQKEKRRVHGPEREADPRESQQSVRRKYLLLALTLKVHWRLPRGL